MSNGIRHQSVATVSIAEKEAWDHGYACGYVAIAICSFNYKTKVLWGAWLEGWRAGKDKKLREIEQRGIAKEWAGHFYNLERRG